MSLTHVSGAIASITIIECLNQSLGLNSVFDAMYLTLNRAQIANSLKVYCLLLSVLMVAVAMRSGLGYWGRHQLADSIVKVYIGQLMRQTEE